MYFSHTIAVGNFVCSVGSKYQRHEQVFRTTMSSFIGSLFLESRLAGSDVTFPLRVFIVLPDVKCC